VVALPPFATAMQSSPPAANAADFALTRAKMRSLGGAAALLSHLQEGGFVADGKLTTGTKPFNVFARVGGGVMTQPGMEAENAALGAASERFVIACNRPDNDEHWASADPEWVGKASMSQRHRFMTCRDLSWQWFNVMSFGLEGDAASLRTAIEMLEAMQAAARVFAQKTPGWSADPARLGMFFHCYPNNSVNSLHMHLVDLSATGPSFAHLAPKNLPLADVLHVLRDELADAEGATVVILGKRVQTWKAAVGVAAVAVLCAAYMVARKR